MWALKRKTTRFSLYFSAQETQDIKNGIKKRLNEFLLKYDDDLGGVMLEYSNMALIQQQMQISSNRTPYLHVEVVADATIFNPKPGKQLVGQVNHLGGDFLSVLVYGIFNAVIFSNQIRGNFQPVPGTKTWVNKENKKEVIKQGSIIIFEVIRIDKQGNVFGITGSMLQPSSGPVKQSLQKDEHLIKYNTENGIGNSNSGFVDSIDEEKQILQTENGLQQVDDSKNKKQKKKEKKRKREEGEDVKEKKKKKKKQKTDEQNEESKKIKIKKEDGVQNGNHEQEANGVILLLDSDDEKKEKKKKKKKKKDKEKKNREKDGGMASADKEQNKQQQQQSSSNIVANGDTNEVVKKKKKKKHKDKD
eukprot:TRINITY_DN8157_c0_g1_i8.p1 TRINITY_DN8157_c0_g1~~TRINITY_DN8157_c0_g1_i8.p1  ORF type:complete len:390 (-),score=75.52 TRINITY_DN8157_c0_g1_i8:435-1517(-)